MKVWRHIESGSTVKELGGFSIIYADPCWQFGDKKPRGGAENHYRTMPLAELKALPVADLAAENAVMFMWGCYPLLKEMLELGEAWGFSYKTIGLQWVKRNAKANTPFFGLGRWTRGNTEGCFIFVRGKIRRVSAKVSQMVDEWEDTPLILDAPKGRHSAKPAIVREKILELMGDLPAIEMFARGRHPSFESWGDEVDQTVVLKEEANEADQVDAVAAGSERNPDGLDGRADA